MTTSSPDWRPRGVALILAGAVAKGAFEAGVVQELVRRELPIRHLVATSSGALNATLLASGIRARQATRATATLDRIWREEATWQGALSVDPRALVGLRGVSNQRKLLRMLAHHIAPTPSGIEPARVRLTIVLAAMNGTTVYPDDPERRMTTYERWVTFEDQDFDTQEGLDRIFDAAVASSTFPGAFAPYQIAWSDRPGAPIGPCVDGGTVNNAPVKLALGDDPSIDTVIVVPASPKVYAPPSSPLRGLDLIGHLGEMLTNERLYRDLEEARRTNCAIAALDALSMAPDLRAQVDAAVGLKHRRALQLVTLFPNAPLVGGAFDGLGKPDLRARYLEIGRRTAVECCDARGW
jgi:NTE family protein